MFFGAIFVHPLPPPAVAQGDGHGPFGVPLADHVFVQLDHDFPGS
jgi:hypothetical protein